MEYVMPRLRNYLLGLSDIELHTVFKKPIDDEKSVFIHQYCSSARRMDRYELWFLKFKPHLLQDIAFLEEVSSKLIYHKTPIHFKWKYIVECCDRNFVLDNIFRCNGLHIIIT